MFVLLLIDLWALSILASEATCILQIFYLNLAWAWSEVFQIFECRWTLWTFLDNLNFSSFDFDPSLYILCVLYLEMLLMISFYNLQKSARCPIYPLRNFPFDQFLILCRFLPVSDLIWSSWMIVPKITHSVITDPSIS